MAHEGGEPNVRGNGAKPFHETRLAKWIVRHPRTFTHYGAAVMFIYGWSLFHDLRSAAIGAVTTGTVMWLLWRPDVTHPNRKRDDDTFYDV